jgi:hypothetical protein
VPIHVITSRHEVLDALRGRGFHDGLAPSRPTVGTMSDAAPLLLNAFAN